MTSKTCGPAKAKADKLQKHRQRNQEEEDVQVERKLCHINLQDVGARFMLQVQIIKLHNLTIAYLSRQFCMIGRDWFFVLVGLRYKAHMAQWEKFYCLRSHDSDLLLLYIFNRNIGVLINIGVWINNRQETWMHRKCIVDRLSSSTVFENSLINMHAKMTQFRLLAFIRVFEWTNYISIYEWKKNEGIFPILNHSVVFLQ